MEITGKSFMAALEVFWDSNLIAIDEQYRNFETFKKTYSKQLFKRNNTYAALTGVMLLRLTRRGAEAEKLTQSFLKAFNRMAEPIFAHRWLRIQMIESFRQGKKIYGIDDVKKLADDAAANDWHGEHLRALFLQHLVEKMSGHFNQALQTAQQIKLLANQYNNPYYKLEAAWAVGHIYFYFGQTEAALNECLRARHLFGNDYSKPQHLAFYTLLSDCFIVCNRLDEALEICASMEQYLKSLSHPQPVAYLTVLSNLAAVYQSKGETAKARTLFEKALRLGKKENLANVELNALLSLTEIYFEQKQYQPMAGAIKKAEVLAQKLEVVKYQIKLLELKAQHAHATGNSAAALNHYQQFHKRYEEWQQLDSKEKLQALETKHELEIQKMRESLMKKEMENLEQDMQQLNAHIDQKDKLINQFAGYFSDLEQTNIRRKEIFIKLREMVQTVKHSQNNERTQYSARFNESHQQAMSALMAAYPAVTNAEAGTAVMLTQGLSNKDVASLTLTTIRNVEKHRLNLRKKLKLKRTDDLIKVIGAVVSKQVN